MAGMKILQNPRSTSELLKSALAVIDSSFLQGAEIMAPLVSGGHDSLSALFVAAQHSKFDGLVFHIDTGIGAKATQAHIKEVCAENKWRCEILKSPETFEMFVRQKGFPGPGMHQWVYIRLKERCVRMIMRKYKEAKVALITGARAQESTRRMGYVEALKIGELQHRNVVYRKIDGKRTKVKLEIPEKFVAEKRRYWVAPCHDWSGVEQQQFMNDMDIPKSPIKLTPLGMSGECMCGCYARPSELSLIRRYAPDVAKEIDRLADIAQSLGKNSTWGTRSDHRKGIVVVKSGPLCNSCDIRAMSAGIMVDQVSNLQCDVRYEEMMS